MLVFPVTNNLKQICSLIHCILVPTRQSIPCGSILHALLIYTSCFSSIKGQDMVSVTFTSVNVLFAIFTSIKGPVMFSAVFISMKCLVLLYAIFTSMNYQVQSYDVFTSMKYEIYCLIFSREWKARFCCLLFPPVHVWKTRFCCLLYPPLCMPEVRCTLFSGYPWFHHSVIPTSYPLSILRANWGM